MTNHTAHRLKALAAAVLMITAALAGAAAPAASSSGSSGSSGSGLYSAALTEHATWSGVDTSGDVLTHGVDGYPGFIIHYSAEKNGSGKLQSWSNDSPEREILYHDSSSNWMLLTAPASEVGVSDRYRTFGKYAATKLSQRSYVESVGLNMRREAVEPVEQLDTEDAFSTPKYGNWATLRGLRGSFDQTGVAYRDDANRTTMQQAAENVSADATGLTGAGITVGVVDTGLNYNKSLYGSRVIAGKNTLTDTEANITYDADGSVNVSESDYSALADGNGHGDFVSSQIAANSSSSSHDGVARDAQLISVRALDDDGSGSTASIAQGIDYACSEGADVLSLSLGGYIQQDLIQEELQECYSEDGVSAVVIAVGNERQTARWVASPADATEELPIISVGALNGNATQSAYFSNVGPDPLADGATPTVAAPGMQIEAQTDTGTHQLSGTSMATPIVSGVIAQLLEAETEIRDNPAQIRDRVERTAVPVENAGTTEVGAGRIDAAQLLSDTEPEETQKEARTESARARDSANQGLSGSEIRKLLQGER